MLFYGSELMQTYQEYLQLIVHSTRQYSFKSYQDRKKFLMNFFETWEYKATKSILFLTLMSYLTVN
jgi:hypothetical protein